MFKNSFLCAKYDGLGGRRVPGIGAVWCPGDWAGDKRNKWDKWLGTLIFVFSSTDMSF